MELIDRKASRLMHHSTNSHFPPLRFEVRGRCGDTFLVGGEFIKIVIGAVLPSDVMGSLTHQPRATRSASVNFGD